MKNLWTRLFALNFSPQVENNLNKSLANRSILDIIVMNSKPIHIIPLAHKKLTQRGIDEDIVFETIQDPDQVVEGHGGRIVAQKKYSFNSREYLLRVVYEEDVDQLKVITCYLTSQISRYWEG